MSIEHRSITGSAPHVTKRLCTVILSLVGVICVLGGFLLGRMAQNQVRKTSDIVPINLTTSAENLYKKAKSIAPKAIHHYDPGKVTARLLDVFHCSAAECGAVTEHNAADFVKNAISIEVNKLLRSIQNASAYLDSLR
ncbi:uncharacterized protein LOC121726434 [Aricia agestis]|uniref:uncharacterized protein LOC121726434 n=1 Tax=Aricia agestis TaxID=91739 RepID=UPI001C201B0E|nr:uncharacterized protein LOC121726434 [Aricia agestis]